MQIGSAMWDGSRGWTNEHRVLFVVPFSCANCKFESFAFSIPSAPFRKSSHCFVTGLINDFLNFLKTPGILTSNNFNVGQFIFLGRIPCCVAESRSMISLFILNRCLSFTVVGRKNVRKTTIHGLITGIAFDTYYRFLVEPFLCLKKLISLPFKAYPCLNNDTKQPTIHARFNVDTDLSLGTYLPLVLFPQILGEFWKRVVLIYKRTLSV